MNTYPTTAEAAERLHDQEEMQFQVDPDSDVESWQEHKERMDKIRGYVK